MSGCRTKELERYSGPEPPPGYTLEAEVEPPPWMAGRPAGMAAPGAALAAHRVPKGAFERFEGPVCFSHGSLWAERWDAMAARLGGEFPARAEAGA